MDVPAAAETASTGADVPPRHRWRRRGPVAALFVLAPWTAECSWGGFSAREFAIVVIFLGPMYGGAAVLIREVARRRGGGWPAIALLAAAFGVIQAGLVDQSLFNSDFLDDTTYAETGEASRATLVPVLGFSAEQAIDFVGGHVLLSICAPIALVEAFVAPARRRRPWLGRFGIAAMVLVYLLGSLLIFSDAASGRKGFLLAPVQAVFAVAVVLILGCAALLPRRPLPWHGGFGPHRPGGFLPLGARRLGTRRFGLRLPHPLLLGLTVLVAHVAGWFCSGWPGVGVRLLLITAVVAAVVGWSRRAGWGQRHVVAAWSAGLVAAAAGAYLSAPYAPTSPVDALVSDVVVSAVTLALVTAAYRRARTDDNVQRDEPDAGGRSGPGTAGEGIVRTRQETHPPRVPGAPPEPGWSAPASA